MGKNVDRIKDFLETLRESGHLKFIVQNRSKHCLSNAEIKRMGLNPAEAEQHLKEIIVEKGYVSRDSNGVFLKEGAGLKVYSCCQRMGLDPYSTAGMQTTGSMPESATEQTSYSDELSYPSN